MSTMPEIVRLDRQEWHTLRHLRLSALHDSPDRFLSTYEKEHTFSAEQWREEFVRGDWHAYRMAGAFVGLLGVTREPGGSPFERWIEYLWVAPSHRRSGFASSMLATVLANLRTSGVRTALLWILDGNDAAMRLYEKVGFVRTNVREDLDARPGRSEEQLRLILK
jgi:ribosomal protein S18 acetylase RimI-like enzyme